MEAQGRVWRQISGEVQIEPNSAILVDLGSVHFASSKRGLMLLSDGIHFTDDGGRTWSKMAGPSGVRTLSCSGPKCIAWTGPANYVITIPPD